MVVCRGDVDHDLLVPLTQLLEIIGELFERKVALFDEEIDVCEACVDEETAGTSGCAGSFIKPLLASNALPLFWLIDGLVR